VRHVFTHFELELHVAAGEAAAGRQEKGAEGTWVALDALSGQALPTLMKKVVGHALGEPD
jgi:A/G-specific adenine glycosylase